MTNTTRFPVNLENNKFNDGQEITKADMVAEQDRNVGIDAANVANFFGSGIVEATTTPTTIFDSDVLNPIQHALLDGYNFDGQNVYVGTPLVAVTDTVNGVQLAITLSDVQLTGAALTKVCIIGDSFGDVLIHDDLVFHENCTQMTRNRYLNVRAILFNGFAGNLYGSASYALDNSVLTGRCIVREVLAMETSPDTIIASQTLQPNPYFIDFVPGIVTEDVMEMLQTAIGADKSVDDMKIGLYGVAKRELVPSDVSTKIGQKFLATGTNIQKISTLLSVKLDDTVPLVDAYDWTGAVVLTIHALQTEVSCPVAPTPDTEIDFDPSPNIIAQLSLTADDLIKQGIVLGFSPQIVDFVFTDNRIADPVRSPIVKDRYYVFTISRAGNSVIGTLQIEEAAHTVEHGYMVVYDGAQWINVTESDMWFSVEGDYVKVADGIAYDSGIGLEIPRIAKDSTNTETPYVFGMVPFYTSTRDAPNHVILQSTVTYSTPVQDQRTGNDVYSRQAPSPTVSLLSTTNLNTLLTSIPAPIILGEAIDGNPRGNPTSISGTTEFIGLAYENKFSILRPDVDLLNNNLVRSILVPDSTTAGWQYRITEATVHTDAYGDINGDGVIDAADLAIISSWISNGYFYDLSDTTDTQPRIRDGLVTVEEILRADVNGDGVVDAADELLISNYIDKIVNSFPAGSSFTRLELALEELVNPLVSQVDIQADNGEFDILTDDPLTPWPIPWRIDYFASWMPELLEVSDLRRAMPTTFTNVISTTNPGGDNVFYVPSDMMIGGHQLNPDGTSYSVDFEFVQVVLDIPITDTYGNPVFLNGIDGILLFDTFVAETGSGKTAYGFNAMKYSDDTYVQLEDFSAKKVKMAPALQSIANEYGVAFGGTIESIVGLYYDPTTSLLTIYVKDLYNAGLSPLPALSVKILVSVYLKKGTFINTDELITKAQMTALLGI